MTNLPRYELLASLPLPALSVDRRGGVRFGNQAAWDILVEGEEVELFPHLPRVLRDAMPTWRPEESGFVSLRLRRREWTAFYEGGAREGLLLFPTAPAVALPLLGEETLAGCERRLAALVRAFLTGEVTDGREACRRLASGLAETDVSLRSMASFGAVAELSFRFAFREPLFPAPCREEGLLTDPVGAAGALGEALELLWQGARAGLPLKAAWRLEGEILFLEAMERTIPVSRCRLPVTVEASEPFRYREDEAALGMLFATVTELFPA